MDWDATLRLLSRSMPQTRHQYYRPSRTAHTTNGVPLS
jgi:hypothetical protein